MSGMMNKIADALTGHHHNATTNTTGTGLNNTATGLNNNANLPAGNAVGGVGTGYSGSNYSAAPNGALKEGAQVRDTGMNAARSHTAAYDSHNKDSTSRTGSNLTGTGAGLATGAALGSQTGSSSYSQQSSTMNSGMNTGMYGNTDSSLNTASTTQSSLGREQAALGQDVAMTRHEEHLLVGKEKVNVGAAQLNKYVTTEKVSTAVPIIRERAVVEREPITDLNRESLTGPDFKEAHYEVNLMEERAVAEKEAVPIERVRLRKEVEQTQQYVEAELRKEHIEIVDPSRNAALGGKSLDSTATTGSQLGRNSAIDSSSRRDL